jgi:uncharacterized SAM-binding protein YcdF (DUF218 family)
VEAIEHAGLAVETAGRAESHIFRDLLVQRGVEAAAIEVEDQSANCGENAEFTRRHLRGQQADAGQRVQSKTTLLLVQDPTMQRRTHASFVRAFSGTGTELISFAPPIGTPPWSKQRYISLVLGELRRLHDTPEGYGPCGRNYIDHIDIPHDVLLAYRNVAEAFPELVRAPGG